MTQAQTPPRGGIPQGKGECWSGGPALNRPCE